MSAKNHSRALLQPSKHFKVMKKLASILLVTLFPILASCSSLMDGNYVHKDGKESPYKATHDPYEPPKDPTSRF